MKNRIAKFVSKDTKEHDPLTAALRDLIEKPCPYVRGKSWAEALVFSLCRRALRGDDAAMIEIFNRIDGKVPEVHEISGPSGRPIPLSLEGTVDGASERKAS